VTFLELPSMYIHLASEQYSKISALQLPHTVSPWMNPGDEGERREIREEEVDEEEEDVDDDEQEEQEKEVHMMTRTHGAWIFLKTDSSGFD